MGPKLEFCGYLLYLYDEKEEDPPITNSEFFKWLKFNSLSKIKEFILWEYLIDRKRSHFTLKRGFGNKWEVYKREKRQIEPFEVYFTFECRDGLNFMPEFERGLRKRLILGNNDLNFSPSPIHLANSNF
jgi:hypothetical protein